YTSNLNLLSFPTRRSSDLYPFIDIHSHQARMPTQDLSALLKQMDDLNMAIMVNLSGRGFTRDWEESTGHLKASIKSAEKVNPSRLVVFTNLVFSDFGSKDWTSKAVKQLEEDVKAGAKGLKIYKSLGFSGIKDEKGNRVP